MVKVFVSLARAYTQAILPRTNFTVLEIFLFTWLCKWHSHYNFTWNNLLNSHLTQYFKHWPSTKKNHVKTVWISSHMIIFIYSPVCSLKPVQQSERAQNLCCRYREFWRALASARSGEQASEFIMMFQLQNWRDNSEIFWIQLNLVQVDFHNPISPYM